MKSETTLSASDIESIAKKLASNLAVQKAESEPELLSIKETCKYLRIGRTTLWKLEKEGKIRALFKGTRRVRFKRADIDKLWND